PGAQRMNGARELALPRAALTRYEHRGARRRDLPRHSIDLLHRGARAHEALEAVGVPISYLSAQILGFDTDVSVLESALDGHFEGIEIEWLSEIVLRAGPHGEHC